MSPYFVIPPKPTSSYCNLKIFNQLSGWVKICVGELIFWVTCQTVQWHQNLSKYTPSHTQKLFFSLVFVFTGCLCALLICLLSNVDLVTLASVHPRLHTVTRRAWQLSQHLYSFNQLIHDAFTKKVKVHWQHSRVSSTFIKGQFKAL